MNIDPAIFIPFKGENESLAGLLLEIFQRFPSEGEEKELENLVFKIRKVERKHIKLVDVYLKDNSN